MNQQSKSNCKHLRTRMSYAPGMGGFGDWRSNDDMTHQYWCTCTMMTAGPDNEFVAPEVCQPERSCYRQSE